MLLFQDLDPETRQMLMEFHNKCVAETGISEETVAQAMTGNLPDDATLKKHIFCMSKKIGFQNDAGELQVDQIKEILSKYVGDPVMEEKLMGCVVQKGDPQTTAYEVAKCAVQVKFVMA